MMPYFLRVDSRMFNIQNIDVIEMGPFAGSVAAACIKFTGSRQEYINDDELRALLLMLENNIYWQAPEVLG